MDRGCMRGLLREKNGGEGEENKEGQGWRGGGSKRQEKNNRMGMRAERWIFKEKGHDGERRKTRNSPVISIRSPDIHDFLFQVLPQASSPIWSGTISSVISPYTAHSTPHPPTLQGVKSKLVCVLIAPRLYIVNKTNAAMVRYANSDNQRNFCKL